MPYIGKEPVAGNFVLLDSITTSATATYALTKDSVAYSPESARNMIVSLNGVTQAPETAFTVSGSNITFSSALTSSDVIDYILVLGDVLSVGTPSDGTVGTSQMSYPLGNFSSTGIDDNATSTAITIDSSENVGVGTTSPLNKFVVSEGTGQHGIELAPGTTSYIQAYDRAIADYGDLKIDAQIIQFGTDNGTERMRISSAGDVQIGTAAVTGGRYFDIYNTGSTATDFAITRFITQQVGSSSTTSADIIKRKNGEFGIINNDTDSAAHINFKVGASERMRIDSSGNVGIGTTSTSAIRLTSLTSTANHIAAQIENSNTADSFGLVVKGGNDANDYAADFRKRDNTNIMRIRGDGNVGIGTTSPFSTARLQVKTGTNLNLAVQTGTTETSGMKINAFNDAATANIPLELNGSVTLLKTGETERMRIDSSGNLLVGATSATGHFTNGLPTATLSTGSTGGKAFSRTHRASSSNNATVDAFRFLDANGNLNNGYINGHLYVTVNGSSGLHSSQRMYYIQTNSNGTLNSNFTLLSTAARGTDPVSSVAMVADGAGGAVKIQITYINNSSVVTSGSSTISFIGQA